MPEGTLGRLSAHSARKRFLYRLLAFGSAKQLTRLRRFGVFRSKIDIAGECWARNETDPSLRPSANSHDVDMRITY
jgi:hypothetical protein